MKATQECYPCLERLLRQAAELATENLDLRARIMEKGLSLLRREFSTNRTSIVVATPLHRLVRALSGNPDPYRKVKAVELEIAAEVRGSLGGNQEGDMKSCLEFAVRGNNIDFFKDPKQIAEDMVGPVRFSMDDTAILERRLQGANSILYLADNAGEVPFDLPLVRTLENHAPVTYVVKESPVQDDITLSDLDEFGWRKEFRRVGSTGTDTPGVDMDMASPEFKAEFEDADLVLAKGMGYWETLSELPPKGKVFHLLKAKCQPVAESLGVALNSYVAIVR